MGRFDMMLMILWHVRVVRCVNINIRQTMGSCK